MVCDRAEIQNRQFFMAEDGEKQKLSAQSNGTAAVQSSATLNGSRHPAIFLPGFD
jgi:hypothetical protein